MSNTKPHKQAITKTIYLPPRYERTQRGLEKLRDDALIYVEADNNFGRVTKIIPEPTNEYYVSLIDREYPEYAVPRSEVEKITCKHNTRHNDMANRLGIMNDFRIAKSKGWEEKRDWIRHNINGNSQLYSVDQNVEDLFKYNYVEQHGAVVEDIPLRLSFGDIETRADLGNASQDAAEVPISSVCHIEDNGGIGRPTLHAFVVDNGEFPELAKIRADLPAWEKEMRHHFEVVVRNQSIELIKEAKGDPDSIHDFIFDYVWHFPETEKDLIVDYFYLVRTTKSDFLGFWFSNYDIRFFQGRCNVLGLNLADLISDENVPPEYRYFNYKEDWRRYDPDQRGKVHYSRFWDECWSTSTVQIYDHESMFSNRRRRFLEDDYKLNTIGELYGYMKKVDLKAEGHSIINVINTDFRLFFKYALQDPVVDFMIEYHTKDMEAYISSVQTTRWTQGFKKTVKLKNDIRRYVADTNDLVLGNDVDYGVREVIPGAIVAKTSNIIKKGIKILGRDSYVFKHCVDEDLTAEYPNINAVFNVFKTTIHGRITSVHTRTDSNGISFTTHISDGYELNRKMETLDTSIACVGEKYFSLPSLDSMISEFQMEYQL